MRKQVADLKSQATGLLYTIERSLKDLGENLPDEEKAEMEITLSRARGDIDKDDLQVLKDLIQRLSQVSSRIMTAISGQAQGPARPSPRPPDPSPQKEGKTKKGGDFEEIKMDFED